MAAYQVLISGGGPVGLGLAIELGQRGISVAVIERNLTPPPIPKGQNLTQRTMEHMQAWGVEDAIRAAKSIPKGYGLGGLTAYGSLLSGYHYDWFKRATVDPFYNAANERLPQYKTEDVLRKRVAGLETVDLFFGWKTLEIAQDQDGVSLKATDGTSNKELKGEYLVGCDGSRSRIREAAGITETREDHDRLMALVVFESEEFFSLIHRFPDKQFYNVLHPDHDGYWMFFGMVEWGKSFFFHAPVPAETKREAFDFKGYIQRAVGKEFDLTLGYVGFWDLRISLADSYRAERVLIAGDAAHSHPPYGGYGINTGFEDARNLGWKLAAVLQGWGGEALLDSYEAERRPIFASTASDFIGKFIKDDRAFVREYDPDRDLSAFETAWNQRSKGGDEDGIGAFAPHICGSPVVPGSSGVPSALGVHDFSITAGRHLPPIPEETGQSVSAQLGQGLTLLLSEGTSLSALRADQTPIKVLRLDPAVDAPAISIVRPDGFVAATLQSGERLSFLIDHALGRL